MTTHADALAQLREMKATLERKDPVTREVLIVLLDRAIRALLHMPDSPRYPLTPRQVEIFRFIADTIDTKGHAPSFEEIAAQFGYASLASVHEHLTNIERKGWIVRLFNQAHGIMIREDAA